MVNRLSDEAKRAIRAARRLAAREGSRLVGARHVFWWIAQDEALARAAGIPRVAPPPSLCAADAAMDDGSLRPGPSLVAAVEEAVLAAGPRGSVSLAGLVQRLIRSSDVRQTFGGPRWDEYRQLCGSPSADERRSGEARPRRGNSSIERLGAVLTDPDSQRIRTPALGRDDILAQLTATLVRRDCPSVILTGAAGAGKTAIVEELARRIAQGTAPEPLRDHTIIELSSNSLLAGACYRGDLEERVDAMVKAAQGDRSLLFFVDEFHTLMGLGSRAEGGYSVMDVLKPHIASGTLRLIGATTDAEYRRYVEADSALCRRFEAIRVPEPDRSEVEAILESRVPELERHHGITIPRGLIGTIAQLAADHLPQLCEPARSVGLLEQAAAALHVSGEAGRPTLTRKHVAAVISARVGAPLERRSPDLARRCSDAFSAVVGQEEALAAVVAQIARSLSPFRSGPAPRCSLLLTGPTGVGKTLTARLLAVALFGDEERLVRLDMSEYSSREFGVTALLGAAPGYVGCDRGGRLATELCRQPHCVLLLDEIEKAHPDVWNLFLQAMDTGFLTDPLGRRVPFGQCYLVATTNAGADVRDRQIGFYNGSNRRSAAQVAEELRAGGFPPELLGRFSAIIPYRPLGLPELTELARRELRRVEAYLTEEGRNLVIPDTDDLAHRLAAAAVSALGARSLRETVMRAIEDEVALASVFEPERWDRCKQVRVEPASDGNGSRAYLDDDSVLQVCV